jgi:DNA-binding protein YbaB
MWDQMKQAKELYRLQKELQKERIEVEEKGVKIIVNGKMEIESVTLNPEITKEEQEQAVKTCFNEALQKIQTNLAQKMQSLK